MTESAKPPPMAEEVERRRLGLLQAVQAGIQAARSNSSKWDPLYKWFHEELKVGTGSGRGPIIGKVITEKKQIGNRIGEMAKSDPQYAVISLCPGVTAEDVLRHMQQLANLPSLKCVLFLDDLTPSRFVVFDD